jgi:hypothetical protein
MEQLSNYLVARYKHGYKVEDIREELAVAYKPAKKKAKPKDTDYASEGIVDFLKKLFGPKKKEEKQTQPEVTTIEQRIEKVKKSVEGITAGEHAVNKIHVFKSGNLLKTLEHKAKQITTLETSSQRHIEFVKGYIDLANKLVAKYKLTGEEGEVDDEMQEQIFSEITKYGWDNRAKDGLTPAELKLFGANEKGEQNDEKEFVTLTSYVTESPNMSSYGVNYHIPRGGTVKVTLQDSDVTKIKSIILGIISTIEKLPTYKKGDDIYFALLDNLSAASKQLLNSDTEYSLDNQVYDLLVDISEDIYQSHVVMRNETS